MKRGKEVKIKTPYQYNVVSGTVDNKNPRSIYIQISAWGNPKNKFEENYDSIIKNKSKRVKRKLYDVLDTDRFYKNRTIVDFNMASSGINYGKRSFMSVEMTLFKKEPLLPVNSEELTPILKNISERIILEVFESDEDFEFHKRKNK
jgi:hypothetical protein